MPLSFLLSGTLRIGSSLYFLGTQVYCPTEAFFRFFCGFTVFSTFNFLPSFVLLNPWRTLLSWALEWHMQRSQCYVLITRCNVDDPDSLNFEWTPHSFCTAVAIKIDDCVFCGPRCAWWFSSNSNVGWGFLGEWLYNLSFMWRLVEFLTSFSYLEASRFSISF